MFDPGVDGKAKIEERQVAHIVRKLMDLGELMPYSPRRTSGLSGEWLQHRLVQPRG